jgi:dTDP-4-dehydrorhamnose reductase
MRQSHSRIYLAGHTGLVGGAILRDLRTRHYQQVITRTHAQLDLTDQSQTRAFFEREHDRRGAPVRRAAADLPR